MHFTQSRVTAAGAAEGWMSKEWWLDSRQGPDRLEPTQSAIQWLQGPLCPTVK